jgi:bifunctional oligoribonuclease and PAP phosphatase NrnA
MRKNRPAQMNSFPEAMQAAILKAERILLCSHVSPDGDTIGSALALRSALNKIGKQVEVVCADEVPQMLMFLTGAGEIRRPVQLKGKSFDLAIAVDVSDRHRLGDCAPLFFATRFTIQVDHHGTNPGYADINVISAEASATGVLIYELIHSLNVNFDTDIAISLYTAIATDTGNFSFDNTTADAFQVMGELMTYGLPIASLNRVLFRERSREQILVLARALSTLTFYHGGLITGMQLSQADLNDCGAKAEHAESIVNYGIDITGVKMTFLAREVDGGTKFSLRALEGCNVAVLAARFGGGGHALAAGCLMNARLSDAVEIMVAAMEKCLLEVTL